MECQIPIWAFEMPNDPVECAMPIWAFKIWMPRWNAQCQSEHSKSECAGGMPNAHLSIQIPNAQIECPMPIWAFEIWTLRSTVLCLPKHSKFNAPVRCLKSIWAFKYECPSEMPNAHICIRNPNAPVECPMPFWAFEIWMLWWHAQCPSEHMKSPKFECSAGMPNAHMCIRHNRIPVMSNAQMNAQCPMFCQLHTILLSPVRYFKHGISWVLGAYAASQTILLHLKRHHENILIKFWPP